eukprot:2748082-Rhodomonas_salina.1
MSGTALAYGATSLRASYAMPGTDLADGATRCAVLTARMVPQLVNLLIAIMNDTYTQVSLSAYALPTRCPAAVDGGDVPHCQRCEIKHDWRSAQYTLYEECA